MPILKADPAADRMRDAGADAFKRGAPCVPGLDLIWQYEIKYLTPEGAGSEFAARMAQLWRLSWQTQAARAHRSAA